MQATKRRNEAGPGRSSTAGRQAGERKESQVLGVCGLLPQWNINKIYYYHPRERDTCSVVLAGAGNVDDRSE